MKQELDKKGNENEREKEAMAEKEDQKMKVEHKQNLKKKETKTEKEQDSADLCGGGEPLAAESLGDPAQQQSGLPGGGGCLFWQLQPGGGAAGQQVGPPDSPVPAETVDL